MNWMKLLAGRSGSYRSQFFCSFSNVLLCSHISVNALTLSSPLTITLYHFITLVGLVDLLLLVDRQGSCAGVDNDKARPQSTWFGKLALQKVPVGVESQVLPKLVDKHIVGEQQDGQNVT